MDLYGQNEATNQANSRNQFVQQYNEEQASLNNNIMNQYHAAKGTEKLNNDLTYAKDVIGNVMSGSAMKSAWDNRQTTVLKANRVSPSSMALGRTKNIPGSEWASSAGVVTDEERAVGGDQAARMLATARNNLAKGIRPPEIGAEPPIEAADSGLIATALNKASSGMIGLEAGEKIAKVGGAVTNATMGGIDAVDDISNLVHSGKVFKKGATWEDDVNNVGQIAAGVSDIVGLVPGLEWVAGLGNIASAATGVISMFGDHQKNIQSDAAIENMKTQVKAPKANVSSSGTIAYGSSSTITQQSQPATITSF